MAGVLLLLALGWFLCFNAHFTVYQDETNKFSIKYPKTWKAFPHPRDNVAVAFLRPKDTVLDTMQENFNVTIQPLPDDLFTLAAFNTRIKRQMMGVFGNNLHIIQDKTLHWGWREGHLMVFEAPLPDHLKMVNAWVFRSTQVFILTFLGDINKYDQDRLYIDEMIRSLQLQ